MTMNFERLDTPQGRFYKTPVGILPSVNTILTTTTLAHEQARLAAWQQRNSKVNSPTLSDAERGTLLHEAIADYLRTKEVSFLPSEVISYWRSIYPWLKLAGASASVSYPGSEESHLTIELPVYHAGLGYAGTFDWVGDWANEGRLALVDFKSSHQQKRKAWLTRYRLQCAAYRLAFQYLFEIELPRAIIPIALPNQTAQVFELIPEEIQADEIAWLERLERYRQISNTI